MKDDVKENATKETTEEVVTDVAELQSQIEQLNDKYLRAMAEMENTRRRATMDAQAVARTRTISVAEKFLPLIDAIGAALDHQPENKDFISFMMAAMGALDSAGIKKIDSVGQQLNPLFHNAIQTEESEQPSGIIIKELQSGYMLGDAVLRPAIVVVSK